MMSDNEQELEKIRARLEKLETQMSYLCRNLGIGSEEVPTWNASATVVNLIRKGDKIAAIKAFIDETGANLKDAKDYIESLKF